MIFPRLSILFVLVAALLSGSTGGASAKAYIDITPVVERYEACVANSDPGLAYRCMSTGEEFAWPSGGLDPRIMPVHVDGGTFLCASVPNMLVLLTTSPSTGYSVQLTLNSPSACSGEATGTQGRATTMDINPQGNPMFGPTIIRFEDDLGRSSFNIGFCTLTPGNLAVSVSRDMVVMLFVPSICAPRGMA